MPNKKRFCVYASYCQDATGRDMAFGDGITAPSNRVYAITDTREEAEDRMVEFNAGNLLSGARIPGNNKTYPCLEIDPYNPLDFVGSQGRDRGDYEGKRYAILCGDLAERAKKERRRSFMKGTP